MNVKIKYNLLEYCEYLGGIFGVYKNYLNNLSNKKKEKLFNLNLFQTTGFKWKSLYLTNNNFDKYFYLKKLILLLKERSYA